jgi:hypothetical protein
VLSMNKKPKIKPVFIEICRKKHINLLEMARIGLNSISSDSAIYDKYKSTIEEIKKYEHDQLKQAIGPRWCKNPNHTGFCVTQCECGCDGGLKLCENS